MVMVLMMTKEGVGKYQLLIYLTFCKEIKNSNNCIQLYIVLKKYKMGKIWCCNVYCLQESFDRILLRFQVILMGPRYTN
jgi:hypothetical protein